MPNNMTDTLHYDWLVGIKTLRLQDRAVIIIGGSEIVRQYVLALEGLGVRKIVVVAATGAYLSKFCKSHEIKLLKGGFKKSLRLAGDADLVIVAPPLPLSASAIQETCRCGYSNILVEKPGSLYVAELESLYAHMSADVRVAYNRLAYPNLHRLKSLVEEEGGITSCRFTFTERLSSINFQKNMAEVYERWGISNSLHVISMAVELIGFPQELHALQRGSLEWHPSGSVFVGHGISEHDIPFSYHADWGSGGRWGVEVNTHHNSYQLIPLEGLYACKRDASTWTQVPFDTAFPTIKPGFAEEAAIMLDGSRLHREILPSLHKAGRYNTIAEEIFNY